MAKKSEKIDDLEAYLQEQDKEIDAAPEVPADDRDVKPFEGFAGGGIATPREIDGVKYADLD